ncbi:hypothetical protein AB0E01_22990 [Nocardia vinacea]|uniref:hypothetical protein n=1 Tax=Nocardia vinacea TaxID=96468 RepID=UPI0034061C65
MYGYQFIRELGERDADMRFELSSPMRGGPHYRHEDAFGYDRIRNRQNVTDGDEFLEAVAGLGSDAPQIRVYVEIPNTLHDERSGQGSIDQEVNARYVSETYGDVTTLDTQFSRSLYVLVFDGPRDGLGVEVDEGLAEQVYALFGNQDVDDSGTRHEIEMELIDRDWDNWVCSQVVGLLNPIWEDAWIEATAEQNDKLFHDALGKFYQDHAPVFDGASWSVDHAAFAKVLEEEIASTVFPAPLTNEGAA